MNKRAVFDGLAATILTASTLSACSQEGSTTSSAPKKGGKPTVCLVMKSLANAFFQGMESGAVAHAQQRGDLKLEAVGIKNETDIDGQVAEIDKSGPPPPALPWPDDPRRCASRRARPASSSPLPTHGPWSHPSSGRSARA